MFGEGSFLHMMSGDIRANKISVRLICFHLLLQDNYLCYYGTTAGIRSEGFVENVVVGHAFLIDSNGLVRWRACAKPTNEEIESLIACSQRMLKYH